MLKSFSKLFGNKSQRDIKEISPLLEATKIAYQSISLLSNDELRAKTQEFKDRIAEYVADERNQIAEFKERIDIEVDMDVDEKELLYQQIDKLEKLEYDKNSGNFK